MKLQETLEHLNFSRLEAQIYMALIGSEPMSAYQLAKKIAIARPSIYNALEHMLDKGMVELVPDQTALYAAQEPEVLLGRMQAEMTANLSLARQQLKEYETAKQPEVHFVFRGFETAMARAGKLLEDARRMAKVANCQVEAVDLGILNYPGNPGVRNCRIANGTAE